MNVKPVAYCFLIYVTIGYISGQANNPFRRYRIQDATSQITTTLEAATPRINFVRKNLKVAIILPQDALNIRNLRGCITREIKKINDEKWNFLRDFNLDSYTFVFSKTYKDIIDTICTLLDDQVITTIYLNYNDNSPIDELNGRLFLKYANLINLPVMTYLPNAYQTSHPRNNEIQLSPTLNHQFEAAMGILARYGWYKYSIIITDFSSNAGEFLDAAYAYDGVESFEILSIVKLKGLKRINQSDLKKKLKSMSIETRVIILHCDIYEAEIIFKAADELGLTTDEYMWILTVSTITSPPYVKFDYKYFPVGCLALWSQISAHDICDTVLQGSMSLWVNALENYYNSIDNDNKNTILSHTKCWKSTDDRIMDLTNDSKYHYGKTFHDYLLNSTTNTSKCSMQFKPNGVLDSIELKIMNLNNKNEWKQIGRWMNKKVKIEDIVWPGLQPKPPLGRPSKFHLRIVTLEVHPFVIYKNISETGECSSSSVLVRIAKENTKNLNKSNNEHFQCASGFYVDLIMELSDKLQFTFDIFEVEDKSFGIPNSFGKWNGIIGDLVAEKADLAMAPITITTQRSQAVDFSVPFMETGISIIVSLRPGKISKTAFLKPYNYMLWIMLLLVSIHAVAIAIFLFEWVINRFRHFKNKPFSFFKETYSMNSSKKSRFNEKKKHYNFSEALWLVWILFFRVAAHTKQPEYFTSKFLINIWACLCLAFMASYTANLAAFMIIKEEYPDLKGVLDKRLTNPYGHSSLFRFGTVKTGSTAEIVKETQPKMFDFMKQFNKNTITEGIAAVKNQELDAFLYDAILLNYRAGLDVGCRLRVVGSWYSVTGYGIAFRKNSKYKDMVDRKILEYIHSGGLERTTNFWFAGPCNNKLEELSNSDGLGVPQSISVFFLLSMGIIIGIIVLLMHIFYKKHLFDLLSKMFGRKSINLKRRKAIEISECNNDACQYEKDQLRKKLCYFNKYFNSMKAIADNPNPTISFLKHNKFFLKNNIGYGSEFAPDKSVQKLILDMFEQYLDKKIDQRRKPVKFKSTVKPTYRRYTRKRSSSFDDRNNDGRVNFSENTKSFELNGSIESLVANSTEQKFPKNLNNELSVSNNHLFYMKRLQVETNV